LGVGGDRRRVQERRALGEEVERRGRLWTKEETGE
jgi:hypothetical protein